MKGRMGTWDAKIAPIANNYAWDAYQHCRKCKINMVQKAEDATKPR
jgi:hypothetical protein